MLSGWAARSRTHCSVGILRALFTATKALAPAIRSRGIVFAGSRCDAGAALRAAAATGLAIKNLRCSAVNA